MLWSLLTKSNKPKSCEDKRKLEKINIRTIEFLTLVPPIKFMFHVFYHETNKMISFC